MTIRRRVDLLRLVGKDADRLLKLARALAVIVNDRYRKVGNSCRKLFAQRCERLGRLGSEQHAQPGRQIVADDIGDRVRLAGSGGTLHDHAVGAFEPSDDLELLVVVREGKEIGLVVAGGAGGFAADARPVRAGCCRPAARRLRKDEASMRKIDAGLVGKPLRGSAASRT